MNPSLVFVIIFSIITLKDDFFHHITDKQYKNRNEKSYNQVEKNPAPKKEQGLFHFLRDSFFSSYSASTVCIYKILVVLNILNSFNINSSYYFKKTSQLLYISYKASLFFTFKERYEQFSTIKRGSKHLSYLNPNKTGLFTDILFLGFVK